MSRTTKWSNVLDKGYMEKNLLFSLEQLRDVVEAEESYLEPINLVQEK